MKKNLFYLIAIAIIASFTFIACGDDDDNTASGPKPSEIGKPTIASKTTLVTLPQNMSTSQDPIVQSISGMVQSLNSISAFSSALTVPENATLVPGKKSTGTYTYKYSDGTNTVFYEYTEAATEKTWTVYYQQGSSAKVKYIFAQESSDGKSGKLEIFDREKSSAQYKWTWAINADESIKYHFESLATEYMTMTIDANIKKDGSGDLKIISTASNDEFLYIAIWDKDGHGTVTYTSGQLETEITF